jgi:hypothetical protein
MRGIEINALTGEQTTVEVPDFPLPPSQAITQLTFAQLLTGLVADAWITEAEGDAWLVGVLPAPVLALIAQLPAGDRFPARARAIRPSVILLNDPMVQSLAVMQNKTPEQLAAFFNQYGA